MARGKVRWIRIEQLNLAQPMIRSGRERLGELAASIEEVGVLVPLVVRSLGGEPEEFAVIAGAGRLEALRVNGAAPSTTVPCVVVEVDDAQGTAEGGARRRGSGGARPSLALAQEETFMISDDCAPMM